MINKELKQQLKWIIQSQPNNDASDELKRAWLNQVYCGLNHHPFLQTFRRNQADSFIAYVIVVELLAAVDVQKCLSHHSVSVFIWLRAGLRTLCDCLDEPTEYSDGIKVWHLLANLRQLAQQNLYPGPSELRSNKPMVDWERKGLEETLGFHGGVARSEYVNFHRLWRQQLMSILAGKTFKLAAYRLIYVLKSMHPFRLYRHAPPLSVARLLDILRAVGQGKIDFSPVLLHRLTQYEVMLCHWLENGQSKLGDMVDFVYGIEDLWSVHFDELCSEVPWCGLSRLMQQDRKLEQRGDGPSAVSGRKTGVSQVLTQHWQDTFARLADLCVLMGDHQRYFMLKDALVHPEQWTHRGCEQWFREVNGALCVLKEEISEESGLEEVVLESSRSLLANNFKTCAISSREPGLVAVLYESLPILLAFLNDSQASPQDGDSFDSLCLIQSQMQRIHETCKGPDASILRLRQWTNELLTHGLKLKTDDLAAEESVRERKVFVRLLALYCDSIPGFISDLSQTGASFEETIEEALTP